MKAFAATAILLMAATGTAWATNGRIPCEIELGNLARSVDQRGLTVEQRDTLSVAASLCQMDPDRARTAMTQMRQQLGLSQRDTQQAAASVSPEWADVH